MMSLIDHLSPDFLGRLLAGMALNFAIAGTALALGLALGVPLALARVSGGLAGAASALVVTFLRAAPTFVVMFFLLNVVPREMSLFGTALSLSGTTAVALSLVPYSTAYVADSGAEALRQLRLGSTPAALLFLPNVARAFFVLVMSSSAGAAIGVTEGITVILRQAERLPALGDRLALFAVGILCFGATLQAGFAAVNLLRRHLNRVALRRLTVQPGPYRTESP
ncbi:MAG TPA: hypothetical protein VKQ29_05170 [Aliidongia sp.]|nr:hypothetical protein [Aliidongia sp.]